MKLKILVRHPERFVLPAQAIGEERYLEVRYYGILIGNLFIGFMRLHREYTLKAGSE